MSVLLPNRIFVTGYGIPLFPFSLHEKVDRDLEKLGSSLPVEKLLDEFFDICHDFVP